MAGRVLRSSNGRFAGSTKGWRAGISKGRNAVRSGGVVVIRGTRSTIARINTKKNRAVVKRVALAAGSAALLAGVAVGVGVAGDRGRRAEAAFNKRMQPYRQAYVIGGMIRGANMKKVRKYSKRLGIPGLRRTIPKSYIW